MSAMPRPRLLLLSSPKLVGNTLFAASLGAVAFLILLLGAGIATPVALTLSVGCVILWCSAVSERVAWVIYCAGLSMSGLSIQALGQQILIEHVMLFVLLVQIILLGRRDAVSIPKRRFLLTLAASLMVSWFVLIILTSLLNAPAPSESMRLLFWLLLNFVALICVFQMKMSSSKMVRDGAITIIVVAGIYLVAWIYANATSTLTDFVEKDYASSTYRLKGLMLEPNLLAAYYLLFLCVAYAFRQHLSSALYWCVVIASSTIVFATYTRTAWIFIALIIALSLLQQKTAWIKILLVPFVLLVASLVFSLEAWSGSTERSIVGTAIGRLEELFDFESGTGGFRMRTWQIAVEEIARDGMLLGHGYNGFTQSHESSITGDGRLYLGLLWLALLYDGGIFAFLLFVTAFVLCWRLAGRKAALFFLAFIAVSTSTNPTWYAFPWVLMALVLREVGGSARLTPPAMLEQSFATHHRNNHV